MKRRALFGAAAAFAAGFAFAPAFAGSARFAATLAGAVAVVTAACLALSTVVKISATVRLAAATAALTVYVVLAVAPGLAVLSGPKRLLTAALPVEAAGPELAVVALAAGLAALGAVEPALRRRAALLPLAAPLVAVGMGSMVSAPAGDPPVALAPALALCGLGLLWTDRGRAGLGTPGWLKAAGTGVVAALVAGVALAAWRGPDLLAGVGRPEPVDARSLVVQPVRTREQTSPLVQFPAMRAGRRPISFSITADHRPERLRYVTLDRFDGTYWTTGASYRRAAQDLPPGPPAGPVEIREERVQVLRPESVGWLVSSGRPVHVTERGLGVDEATGDLVVPAGGTVPARYTVRSAVPRPDPAALAAAVPAPGMSTVDVPADLSDWARQLTGDERSHAALRRLTEHLREFLLDGSDEPAGGHGLYQIRRLRQTRHGTAEQFASAFAVLARATGFDARVVVGFRPRPVAAGGFIASGADVHAWAEVRFEAVGWVPFDPTPTVADPAGGEPEPEPSASPEPEPTGAAAPPPAATAGPPASPPAGAQRASDSAVPWLVFTVTLAVAAGAAGAVPVKRLVRRRRRRRAADAGLRAVGAWREARERLAGLRLSTADTVGEVVAAADGRFGAPVAGPLARLARLHDLAAYGPGPLAAPAADEAWRLADEIRLAVRRLRRAQ